MYTRQDVLGYENIVVGSAETLEIPKLFATAVIVVAVARTVVTVIVMQASKCMTDGIPEYEADAFFEKNSDRSFWG